MSRQARSIRRRVSARVVTIIRVGVAVFMVGSGALIGAGGWHSTARADNSDPVFGRGGSSSAPSASGDAVTSAGGTTAGSGTSLVPVTVHGTGRFSSLSVTVSQTNALINEVVLITWTGGIPTQPPTGGFDTNYLQIMQCWGDDPAGPRRDQCQFGPRTRDERGGAFSDTRQVNAVPRDPLETISDPGSGAYVPFTPATGDAAVLAPDDNQFFDGQTTNEIPFARTGVDGTGQAFMEVETSREAPGLGCGEALHSAGAVSGRSCWLAIVPRDNKEVDGATVPRPGTARLNSSALAASNWANRMVVPLQFQPIGAACPIGAAERKTFGQEQVSQAIRSWQPTLCGATGAVFGYSQVSDGLARAQLATTDPGFAFVSKPVESTAGSSPVVYAPLALSGVAFAFNIDVQTFSNAPPEVKARNGQRITQLKLTPRLVAKLLTQTYSCSIQCGIDYLSKNPRDLTTDKDFLAVNPEFAAYGGLQISDLLEPLGDSDMASQIWSWIDADPDAHAYMSGQPDPWGTKINPAYLGMQLPVANFPKSDQTCFDPHLTGTDGKPIPPTCEFDRFPYANDMQSAARAASRGDTLAVNRWDSNATPPAFKKADLQLSGAQELIAIADTATAARYSLPVAKVRNAAGEFVAPTKESLTAGLAAMSPTDSGVLVPDATKVATGAYPLTVLSYGATSPAGLDTAGRHDYAAFIDYAVSAGQQPGLQFGQLPLGYEPLPVALQEQALAVAKTLGKRPGVELPTPTPTPTEAPVVQPPPAHLGGGGGRVRSVPAPVVPPAAAAAASATSVPLATSSPTAASTSEAPAVALAYTPVQSVGIGRNALTAALILGGLCALAGPALIRTAIRAGR